MPKLLIKLKKNKTQAKIKKPNFYEVILLNDDFTGVARSAGVCDLRIAVTL